MTMNGTESATQTPAPQSVTTLHLVHERLRRRTRRYRAMVDASLEGLFASERTLDRAIRHVLFAESKRVRASLALIATEAAGGDAGRALPIAIAFELLHTASLVHDDIMDGAWTRRGRPCVHRVFGVPLAITAGDALIFAAYGVLQRLFADDPAAAMQVVEIFTRSAVRACRGQAQDLAVLGRRPTLAEYLRMVRAKTGSMIEAPLESGAVLAGAPALCRLRLREYGRCLGIAFQILDDAIDAVGSAPHAGKTLGNDRRWGRATAVTIATRDGVDEPAVDVARCLCARYSTRALAVLHGIAPSPARDALADMAGIVADWTAGSDAAEAHEDRGAPEITATRAREDTR
jgi:geranylgeranyl pyrophosphate synthase